LISGGQDLLGRDQILDVGRRAVDRPTLLPLDRAELVDRLAEQVEDPSQRLIADRHRDRTAGIDHRVAALESVGGVHRHGPHPVVAEVLLDLADQVHRPTAVALGHLDLDRVVNLRQIVGEHGIDDDAGHLFDSSYVVSVAFSHFSNF